MPVVFLGLPKKERPTADVAKSMLNFIAQFDWPEIQPNGRSRPETRAGVSDSAYSATSGLAAPLAKTALSASKGSQSQCCD